MPARRLLTCHLAVGSVAFAIGTASSCVAGTITTHQFDLTETPLGVFGMEFTQDYLVDTDEIIGGQIVDVRIHLEFNSQHALGSMTNAANLEVQFQPPVEGVPFWNVKGSDLGWSGTGPFIGDLSTDTLNLPFLDLPPDAFSLWFVRIINNDNGTLQPLGGQLTNSYIQVDVLAVPAPATALTIGLLGLARRRRRL
jgi:hypothetical protein